MTKSENNDKGNINSGKFRRLFKRYTFGNHPLKSCMLKSIRFLSMELVRFEVWKVMKNHFRNFVGTLVLLKNDVATSDACVTKK